jgi:hypothetical protein
MQIQFQYLETFAFVDERYDYTLICRMNLAVKFSHAIAEFREKFGNDTVLFVETLQSRVDRFDIQGFAFRDFVQQFIELRGTGLYHV